MAEQKLPDWIQEHLTRYKETNGAEGHMWNGFPCLLLTTKGRKSQISRQLPLIYGERNGDYILVASKGGHSHHPSWYLNLEAEPIVELQVKDEKFQARTRTAKDSERQELWQLMSKLLPVYDEYRKRAGDREIPVVVCERLD